MKHLTGRAVIRLYRCPVCGAQQLLPGAPHEEATAAPESSGGLPPASGSVAPRSEAVRVAPSRPGRAVVWWGLLLLVLAGVWWARQR
jgi:hypothetical protein